MLKWIFSALFTLAFLAMAGFAVLFFLANFSSTETIYACNGSFTNDGEVSAPETIYISLENYRWWVGLWSDSDGSLWLEIPGHSTRYFSNLKEASNFIQIFEYDDTFAGQVSTLSGNFSINTTYGVFDGQCALTKRPAQAN